VTPLRYLQCSGSGYRVKSDVAGPATGPYLPAMPIYWKLREALDTAGMTPLQLAVKLDVAHPTIYRMARQKQITRITTDMLGRLCKALDCQPGDLLEYRRR
jgi:putative transcriptional regulator